VSGCGRDGEAVAAAARTGLASTRQKLATRLAQLVHASDLDAPAALVARITGGEEAHACAPRPVERDR
jgi:hypothetical protein